MTREKGFLILEDGTKFEGMLFGARIEAQQIVERAAGKDRGYGEVVFNTSMTGYQEILTDPSYYGQIVCMTTPHIGNTGINSEDSESAHPWCGGFIVHELPHAPSNWRSESPLEDYLVSHRIPGLFNIDTRALTKRLRMEGVIRGLILPEADAAQASELLRTLPLFEGRDLIGEVTTREPYFWRDRMPERGFLHKDVTPVPSKYRVVAMDFGVKYHLLRSLEMLGCDIEVVPASMTAEEILSRKPHGVFLSNGPGDPAAAPYAAKTVSQLLGKLPLFGVCMGHQILSLAIGAKTYKLKFGHRGGNQPVLDTGYSRVEISSHNHGYSVDARTLPAFAKVTHTNLNDKTVEGIALPEHKAFSVQYHPEACPGPHDSQGLFDRFIDLMARS